jgi:prophage regulatory protein
MSVDATSDRPRLIRLRDVLALTGLRRSTLYARIGAGLFPQPVHLGPRAVGWVESEYCGGTENASKRRAAGLLKPHPGLRMRDMRYAARDVSAHPIRDA